MGLAVLPCPSGSMLGLMFAGGSYCSGTYPQVKLALKLHLYPPAAGPREPPIPKLKRQDMTLEQLRQYDGTGEHNRVCVGVNGKIFDVTRGKKFYGPGESSVVGRWF